MYLTKNYLTSKNFFSFIKVNHFKFWKNLSLSCQISRTFPLGTQGNKDKCSPLGEAKFDDFVCQKTRWRLEKELEAATKLILCPKPFPVWISNTKYTSLKKSPESYAWRASRYKGSCWLMPSCILVNGRGQFWRISTPEDILGRTRIGVPRQATQRPEEHFNDIAVSTRTGSHPQQDPGKWRTTQRPEEQFNHEL